ncbi:unnamed protein product [Litomosoides sigmodontis]|uniref:Uncharacterized protein n=1 Tax=Litomosoides sigmodontis TaxID=42156 RepID=A0A3P6UAW1_LITSI|nr:unnamed protein product [Litomosoides sigmodontis]
MKDVMKIFLFTALLLFISRSCYGSLEIDKDELVLRTHGIMHARRVRDTDKRDLEKHYVISRRPARRGVKHEKPKHILKNKKYKTNFSKY